MAAVETALTQARAAGRPSLVAYVTGGIREDWTDLLTAMIEAGADAVEIGLPFSDPMLDGYTIQQASNAAISRGATMAGILSQLSEAAASRRQRPAHRDDVRQSRLLQGPARVLPPARGRGIQRRDHPRPSLRRGRRLPPGGRPVRPGRHLDGHPRDRTRADSGDRLPYARFPVCHERHGHDRNLPRERRHRPLGGRRPRPHCRSCNPTAPGRC